MSDTGSVGNGCNSASRHEKSLGLLTTRFVSLLQDAKDGVLDLKIVSSLSEERGTLLERTVSPSFLSFLCCWMTSLLTRVPCDAGG